MGRYTSTVGVDLRPCEADDEEGGQHGSDGIEERKEENIEAWAAAALLRKAGFDTVVDATKSYREAGAKGLLKVTPRKAFDWSAPKWLHTEEFSDGEE